MRATRSLRLPVPEEAPRSHAPRTAPPGFDIAYDEWDTVGTLLSPPEVYTRWGAVYRIPAVIGGLPREGGERGETVQVFVYGASIGDATVGCCADFGDRAIRLTTPCGVIEGPANVTFEVRESPATRSSMGSGVAVAAATPQVARGLRQVLEPRLMRRWVAQGISNQR